MKITTNKFVSIAYELSVGEGDDRELMERATSEVPMSFIFDTGMMLPAFEDKLLGLGKGQKFKFTLVPADAYGEYNDEHLLELPQDLFKVEGEFDASIVKEGNIVPMMDSNGNRLNGSVLELREDTVLMDFNHPLAGETLHFEGEVLDVHDPTEAEIASLAADNECSGDECSGCHGCQ